MAKRIYMRPEVDLDKPIARYMKWEHLKSMLETGRIYINRRSQFDDRKESKLKLWECGSLYPFHSKPSTHEIESNLEVVKEKIQLHERQSLLPTSCWTLNSSENYLMWKSYATEKGVMIISSINRFSRAIDYTGYDLICLPMTYCGYWGVGADETSMCKDKYYSDERELRFYFDFDTDNQFQVDGDHIELPVNPKELISVVVISPFVDNDTAAERIKELREKYNIMASYSAMANLNRSMCVNVNGHK